MTGRLPAVRHPVNGYRLFDPHQLQQLASSTNCRVPFTSRDALNTKVTATAAKNTPRKRLSLTSTEASNRVMESWTLDRDYVWLTAPTKPKPSSKAKSMLIGDAFCGGGIFSLGIEEGLRRSGFNAKHSFGIDFEPDAIRAYEHNFSGSVAKLADVADIIDGVIGSPATTNERLFQREVGKKLDVLIGGPPCQGHSDLNNHTRRSDAKNELYFSMSRLAELFKPQIVIIENVPGVAHDKGGVVQLTTRCLLELGYFVSTQVIDLRQIGVPQKRRRFVLVATKRESFDFEGALASKRVEARPISWALQDLLAAYDEFSTYNSSSVHSSENKRRIDYLFEHDLYDLPNSERPPCHRDKKHSYGAVYGRMRWDDAAPTITGGFGSTGQGRFVHPKSRRTLTPHEACRLQFVPDYYSFPTALGRRSMQQIIGNAAPPRLGQFIIESAVMQELLS